MYIFTHVKYHVISIRESSANHLTSQISQTLEWFFESLYSTKLELAGRHKMHDLGEACWFLVMEITCDQVAWTITIDQ